MTDVSLLDWGGDLDNLPVYEDAHCLIIINKLGVIWVYLYH